MSLKTRTCKYRLDLKNFSLPANYLRTPCELRTAALADIKYWSFALSVKHFVKHRGSQPGGRESLHIQKYFWLLILSNTFFIQICYFGYFLSWVGARNIWVKVGTQFNLEGVEKIKGCDKYFFIWPEYTLFENRKNNIWVKKWFQMSIMVLLFCNPKFPSK